jgi:hypothetical protein
MRLLVAALPVAFAFAFGACHDSYRHGGHSTLPPGPSTISSVSPAQGSQLGGTLVTITGTNLAGLSFDQPMPLATGAKTASTSTTTSVEYAPYSGITFGGGLATGVVVSPDGGSLTCYTPPGLNKGRVDVVLTTPTSGSTLAQAFVYSDLPPTVASVSPATAPSGATTAVTITGSGFLGGGGPYYPPYPGGPLVATPANGATGGSAPVNQTAIAFPYYVLAPTVKVGGLAATSVVLVSPTQLTCVLPDDTNGAKDVVVTNPDGQSATLKAGFTRSGTITKSPSFVGLPTSTAARATIAPAVRVAIVDQNGNTIATAGDSVTIAIGTNAGAAGPGVLLGTLTVPAVNGIATFADLSIDRAGNGYTLVATVAGSSTTATTPPFNVN